MDKDLEEPATEQQLERRPPLQTCRACAGGGSIRNGEDSCPRCGGTGLSR